MPTILDSRQTRNRAALPNIGSAVDTKLDTVLGLVDTKFGSLGDDLTAAAEQNAQDRGIKLIEGGSWKWTLASNALSLSETAYIQIPGLEDQRNTIALGTMSLAADGDVAYVTLVRSGTGANVLAVSVGQINSVVLTENVHIIARRIGNTVSIGNTFSLKDGEILELDGALAEINRYFGQLQLREHATNKKRVIVTGADVTKLNGTFLSQTIKNLLLKFDGAEIDFSTGSVYEDDGATALGINFTPFDFTGKANEFYYYSITLIASTVNADSTINGQLLVIGGSNSNAVLVSAQKAAFGSGGLPLGQVIVQNDSGTSVTAINDIAQASIIQLGVGSGGGSSSGDLGGAGGELVDLLYQANLQESFTNIPNEDGTVDVTAGKTDGNNYDIVNQYFRISYDADKTVTGVNASMVLSAALAFTIKVGDVVVVADEVREIVSIASQTSFTIDTAFSIDPTAAVCLVSQAVYTVDLNAFDDGGESLSVGAQLTNNFSNALIGYTDSEALDDTVGDWGNPALIAYSANGSSKRIRTDNLSDEANDVGFTSTTNLVIRFFANKITGEGEVNLLSYKAFWHSEVGDIAGWDMFSAFAHPSRDKYLNCSHSVSSEGKSRFTFDKPYIFGYQYDNPAGGGMMVFANGNAVPRKNLTGMVDETGAYFIEISSLIIEMDSDYTLENVDFQFRADMSIIDNSDNNIARITAAELDVQRLNSAVNKLAEDASEGFYGDDDSARYIELEGSDVDRLVFANLVAQNKSDIASIEEKIIAPWQKKSLASAHTGAGEIADLTFNNLEIGKYYRVSGTTLFASTGVINIQLKFDNGDAKVHQYITCKMTSGAEELYQPINFVFEADTTVMRSYCNHTSNGSVAGGQTQLVLEELPNHIETSKWT